jgi:hypothetical protein
MTGSIAAIYRGCFVLSTTYRVKSAKKCGAYLGDQVVRGTGSRAGRPCWRVSVQEGKGPGFPREGRTSCVWTSRRDSDRVSPWRGEKLGLTCLRVPPGFKARGFFSLAPPGGERVPEGRVRGIPQGATQTEKSPMAISIGQARLFIAPVWLWRGESPGFSRSVAAVRIPPPEGGTPTKTVEIRGGNPGFSRSVGPGNLLTAVASGPLRRIERIVAPGLPAPIAATSQEPAVTVRHRVRHRPRGGRSPRPTGQLHRVLARTG